MTNILPISRIPTIPKPAAVPSLWNHIYDEIDDRLKKLNDGKQEVGSGMDGFAPINSPAFTGSPTAPTPSTSDSDTSVATTAFVQAAIASNAAANSRPGHTYAESDWAWADKAGGLKVQWLDFTTDNSNTTEYPQIVTLPFPFVSAVFFATASPDGGNSSALEHSVIDWTTPGKTTNAQIGVYTNYVGNCRLLVIGV